MLLLRSTFTKVYIINSHIVSLLFRMLSEVNKQPCCWPTTKDLNNYLTALSLTLESEVSYPKNYFKPSDGSDAHL